MELPTTYQSVYKYIYKNQKEMKIISIVLYMSQVGLSENMVNIYL